TVYARSYESRSCRLYRPPSSVGVHITSVGKSYRVPHSDRRKSNHAACKQRENPCLLQYGQHWMKEIGPRNVNEGPFPQDENPTELPGDVFPCGAPIFH